MFALRRPPELRLLSALHWALAIFANSVWNFTWSLAAICVLIFDFMSFAAARTRRTGRDAEIAPLRDLVSRLSGEAGETRREPTARARETPRAAAHWRTDVAITCGDRLDDGWCDRASPSDRPSASRPLFEARFFPLLSAREALDGAPALLSA